MHANLLIGFVDSELLFVVYFCETQWCCTWLVILNVVDLVLSFYFVVQTWKCKCEVQILQAPKSAKSRKKCEKLPVFSLKFDKKMSRGRLNDCLRYINGSCVCFFHLLNVCNSPRVSPFQFVIIFLSYQISMLWRTKGFRFLGARINAGQKS